MIFEYILVIFIHHGILLRSWNYIFGKVKKHRRYEIFVEMEHNNQKFMAIVTIFQFLPSLIRYN